MEHLTKETFREKVFDYKAGQDWKYKGTLPCIIDFYADWCGPCRMVAPVLEELAVEYAGKVEIFKVDTETEEELSEVFKIQSIPSILFCPVGGEPQMKRGAMPKHQFVQAINEIFFKK